MAVLRVYVDGASFDVLVEAARAEARAAEIALETGGIVEYVKE